MAELPTFQEVYDAARAEVQRRRPALTDFTEGSVNDALAGSGSVLVNEVAKVVIDSVNELFFATATDEALDRLAADRLNLERDDASAAIGEVQWTRDAAGAYTVPEGTVFSATENGVTTEYESTSAVSFLASDTTLDIPVQATATGTQGNVDAGAVNTIVSSFASDPNATVTNALRMSGGSDVESNEAFRARIRNFFPSIARGTVGALEFAAVSINGVTIAVVVEDFDDDIVYVYIGDPDATANDALADLVRVELDNWRAAGVRVVVASAAAEELTITINLTVPTGSDQTTLTSEVRAAISDFASVLGAGEPLYISATECAALDANDLIESADITLINAAAPTGTSVSPTLNTNAIRIPEGNITVTYTEV